MGARTWFAVGALVVFLLTIAAGPAVALPSAGRLPIGSPQLVFASNTRSENWAGYAVTGPAGSVSAVKASWIEPAVSGKCPKTAEYASFWVGIDGYNSKTVEQTGTDTDCHGGSPSYYAWYEFFPRNSVTISSLTIHAGDKISASVTYAGGKFTTKIADLTSGKSFSKSSTVSGAKRSSAEWIAETPEVCSGSNCSLAHLTDFGTVDFGKDHTGVASTDYATISGTTLPFGDFSKVFAITMTNTAGTKTMASPSAVSSDRTSFAVKWVSPGP